MWAETGGAAVSREWSDFRAFTCTNGCEPYGVCPGHRMRLVFLNTSDHIVVEIDPDETQRPGNSEWRYLFDDDTFNTMVDLAIEMRARWAAIS